MPLKKALLLSAAMPLMAFSLATPGNAQDSVTPGTSPMTVAAGPVVLAQADAAEDSEELRKKRKKHDRQGGEERQGGAKQQTPADGQEKPARKHKRQQTTEPSGQKGQNAAGASSGDSSGNPQGEAAPKKKPRDERSSQPKTPSAPEKAAPASEKTAPENAGKEERNQRRKPREERRDQQKQQRHDNGGKSSNTTEEKSTPRRQQEAPATKQEESQPQKPAQQEQPSTEQGAAPTPEAAPSPETGNAPAPETKPQENKASPEQRNAEPPQENAAPAEGSNAPAKNGNGKQPSAEPSGEAAAPAEAGEEPQRLNAPNGAPVLDSAKHGDRETTRPRGGERDHQEQAGERQKRRDRQNTAQEKNKPVKIESVEKLQGKRMDHAPKFRLPQNAKVEKESKDRVIVNIDNRNFIENRHHTRIRHGARDVHYESLPRGNTKEVVVRRNGVRVVTIRNEYGDIIHRSRIGRNGHETVLIYAPDYGRGGDRFFREPDLPPIRLTAPVDTYILEARQADESQYVRFLEKPPIEPVHRVYTLDQVRYSARLRDIMPRIDLDTVTFDTGSAAIGQSQAGRLAALADAMKAVLDKDPGQVFLIEGHTDAVGSDQANLILSDERAESVARALTQDFDVPPENLVTQGYGEEYLKIDTDGPSRENRRVTVRRITPLIRPDNAG